MDSIQLPSTAEPAAVRRFDAPVVFGAGMLLLVVLALPGQRTDSARAQACPPYCETPVITPAWHLHMCDVPYQEQLDDNRCMRGPGVTEFPAGTDRVYIIYCHHLPEEVGNIVRVQVKDSGGGLQYVNHPDGITYVGDGCETLVFQKRTGIPPGGSPYFTSAVWPEGPFSGIGAGIEWFVGLFVAFDADFYYGLDAEAVITARDPAANLDPLGIDEITVQVSSTTDPVGISMRLVEQSEGFPVFKAASPLRFSDRMSDAAAGVIRVNNNDTITVSYCPRGCTTPYIDTATWIQIHATVTPTSLPTYAGPRPTATNTPPPGVPIEHITLRPAPEDVGYVPQISANQSRVNHLGYPTIYSGMWTSGRNRHFGMIQFRLDALPAGARTVDARLEMIGQSRDFIDSGEWTVQLLDPSMDAGWRSATFEHVKNAVSLARIGPVLGEFELTDGRTNTFGFSPEQLGLLDARLDSSRRVSFRVDGPGGEDNNLFAWHSGVDVYERASAPPDPALGPSLTIGYVPAGTGPSPTPPPSPTSFGPTATPSATSISSPTVDPLATPTPTLTPGGSETAVASPTTPGGSAEPSATSAEVGTPTDVPSATPIGGARGRQACITAFDDRDGDGSRSPDERFIAGLTVQLTHIASGAFVTWTTDGANDPDFCWNGLVDGQYTIAITERPRGMIASGPTEYRFDVPMESTSITFEFGVRSADAPTALPTDPPTATPSALPTLRPTPTPLPTVVGPQGTLCAIAFSDIDANGFDDPGEPLIEDASIRIEDEHRSAVRALMSRSDGAVCVPLAAGVYYVSSEPVTGYEATTSIAEVVLLTDGDVRNVRFGWHRRIAPNGSGIYLPFALRQVRPRR